MEQDQRRVLQACDAVGDFIAYWGFKGIYGRIWAYLAMRKAPTHQADIARTFGVSRALVSGSIAELLRLGLVRQVGAGRNAPVAANLDVWPTISDVLRGREWMLLESARQSFLGALEEVEVTERGGGNSTFDTRHIRFLLTMTEIAQGLLKLLLALRTPTQKLNLSRWSQRARSVVRGVQTAMHGGGETTSATKPAAT
jgi:DNA-binding transcriptional regulator GbsR (MarR family)